MEEIKKTEKNTGALIVNSDIYYHYQNIRIRHDIDEKLSAFNDLGISNNELAWPAIYRQLARAEYYPDHPEIDPFEGAENPWFYEEVGDTAIITFDSFAMNRNDYYTEANLENPNDTIELISYAHSQTTHENSPINTTRQTGGVCTPL